MYSGYLPSKRTLCSRSTDAICSQPVSFLMLNQLRLGIRAKDAVSFNTKMPLQYSHSIRSAVHSVFRTLSDSRHKIGYAYIFCTGFTDPAAACSAHINMNKAARKHSTAIISNTTTLGEVGQGRYIQCDPNRINAFDPDISGSTKAMLATRASTDGDVIGRSTIPRIDVDRSAEVSADLF
nr:MAG TPA: hypothetical protein [Caudoviricetes sp.]